ncbi:hypothetical protein [uncultured Nostoc sp.]|uniref:hypothetical protein n=1 Tax=uncultured Nostoc sp. TaxID=340711 RepID=UPI00262E016A|nr:hypothetical protein [uncultured Nostoc sp.]
MTLIQKSKIVSVMKQYKRAFAWFISGLVLAILLFLGTLNQQPATASNQSHVTTSTQPDVSATHSNFENNHLEPNFYQY